MGTIIQILFVLALLLLGYVIGSRFEKRHYRSIIAREGEMNKLPAMATRTLPPDAEQYRQQLVMGNVTISVDYFKRFLATLHNFFGGRVTSYETC